MTDIKNKSISKFGRTFYILTYIIGCLIILLILYFGKQYKFNNLTILGVFSVTSGIYLSLYCSLKLNTFRLKEKSTLKVFIDRIHISLKVIFIHILIIIIGMIFITIYDTDSNKSIIENVKVDESVIRQIEEGYGRRDIVSSVEINGNYMITFSDKTKKYLKNNDATNTTTKDEDTILNIPYSIRSSISFVTRKADLEHKYGKPEVVRKQSEYSYEIRTLKDKSKLFVFYGKDENVIDSWRLNKLLNRNDFESIKLEESKESDVRKIDPYFQIIGHSEKNENGFSEHRLDDNGIIKIEYKKVNNLWVVSSIMYEKEDPSGFVAKLLPEDKTLILK